MASGRDYLEFILDQLSGLDGIRYRYMMGEYILYYRGRIFGGIYDDRLLVKNVPAATEYMPDAVFEIPYEGGSPMLLVDDVDDRDYLTGLIEAVYPQLPETKKRSR